MGARHWICVASSVLLGPPRVCGAKASERIRPPTRAVALGAAIGLLVLPAADAVPRGTSLISVSSRGAQGNRASAYPSISGNGRFVAFASWASNLAPGDTNRKLDVFVHDLRTGATRRISVRSDGGQARGDSFLPQISASGRFVAFRSWASNLVPGDTNRGDDVFVHDRRSGSTSRVNVNSGGEQAVNERAVSTSFYGRPSLSADGRFIAFDSIASNLVAADANGTNDVFVRDRRTRATERVSVDSDGEGGQGSFFPQISADGRFVAFVSETVHPVTREATRDVLVNDRSSGETTRASIATGRAVGAANTAVPPAISADGHFVAFDSSIPGLVRGDTNSQRDVFVHDTRTRATTRVSVSSRGRQGNGPSTAPVLSARGRFVAFFSRASNLVADDTNGGWDVFVHDRRARTTIRASISTKGRQGNLGAFVPALSSDGHSVAFFSRASNLVAGDTNKRTDVFVRDLRAVPPRRSKR